MRFETVQGLQGTDHVRGFRDERDFTVNFCSVDQFRVGRSLSGELPQGLVIRANEHGPAELRAAFN
ncbi:hypothetical protein OSK94_23390, partial [Escherichia coli]|nr:hypothetical protein [Escherichia coli]